MTSDGSRPCFFSRGVITADLKTDGNTPVANELLKRIMMKGDMVDAHSLSSHVEMGPRSDCLLLVRWIQAVTSLLVTSVNDPKLCDVVVNVGVSASAVVALIPATFLSKKSWS